MDATLIAANGLALAARARGQRFIRLEVEPKRNFGERYVRLWNSALGKTIGRRTELDEQNGFQVPVVAMLIVEVGVADVLEAFRMHKERDADFARCGPESIAANKFSRPQRISTAR
jgi:hypothetical protein